MREMHVLMYIVKFLDTMLVLHPWLHPSGNAFKFHIALHFEHYLAHKQNWIPFLN